MSFADEAASLEEDLVQLRRALHREPEIGLDLPRTQEKVLRALDGMPLEITLGQKTTSVTAVLRGTAPAMSSPTSSNPSGQAPAVLLRADMDALPVQERTGVAYTSHVDGAMHACGHDLHTAMLVGAARLLNEQRDRLAGDVVFMFQPGEEGWDGASVMVDEGVLEASGRRADAAYGLHVFSALMPGGQFVTKPGTMLAASGALTVTVVGAGGHGSAPHLANDPVTVVAEMITSLQTMVTRRFDVFDPVVVTVGVLSAGSRRNIIPETASFEATVRSFSARSRERLVDAIPRLLHGIAAAHGAQAEVRYEDEYPVTVNNPDETAFAAATITEVFGDQQHAQLAAPLSGSEDFSRVLARVPGSFVGLGATPVGADPHTAPFNHSPYAVFDDAVLASGAALYAELATRRLALLTP
ncbi:MAG TPA: M20 family metallopeptidase [Intrasporangium sp.]|uniref:M20 metallopeptidase family protein n=1 Tax=Intrasporangium sp. TaxID=1925024 RepID=UPI002D78368E|nr:M20 family metallopeptidase [Intrasporangium sp.]HET7396963.1 M20 family metallopeptidase [Intrasporangium sp.]